MAATKKRFQKFMLHAGTYFDGNGRRVPYDAKRILRQHETFKRLQSSGYDVPVHFDHSDDPTQVVPVKRSNGRSARNTAGILAEFNPSKDGRSAQVVVELSDPKAIQLAESDHVQLSPIILPEWSDGKGQRYQDVITTMDLVNLPADNSQTSFEPVADMIACSLRMGLDGGTRISKPFLLAKDPDDMSDDDDEEDDDDVLDDLDGDDETSDDDMDAIGGDDADFDASDGMDDIDAIDDLAGGDTGEESGDDDMGDDMGGDDTDMGGDLFDEDMGGAGSDDLGDTEDPLLDLDDGMSGMDSNPEEDALVAQIKVDFEAIGIAAPETDPRDDIIGWLATMVAVLKQKAMDDGSQDLDDDGSAPDDFSPTEEEPITVQAPNFATMGLDPRQAKIVNQRWQKMQAKVAQSTRQANAAASAAIRMSRQEKVTRLNTLLKTGRCTPAEFKKWGTALKAVKMSLAPNGIAKKTRIDQFIEDREALPEGAAMPVGHRLSRANVVTPDFDTTGDMTPEKAREVNDKLAKQNPGAMRRQSATA